MSADSWSRSLEHLREMHDNRYAQASAVVLIGARGRWHRAVVARTSIHDLLFTLPEDEGYPFVQSVTVAPRDGGAFEVSWDGGRLQEKRLTDLQHVDGLLDAFLERLTSPTFTCRECGGRVLVGAKWFETFERMHYLCFHYQFEHGAYDRDEECRGAGCPSASIEPWHVANDLHEAVVGQLLGDLRTGDLASESLVVQVEREGPGVIAARFDEDRYLVTVRRVPTSPAQERKSSDPE